MRREGSLTRLIADAYQTQRVAGPPVRSLRGGGNTSTVNNSPVTTFVLSYKGPDTVLLSYMNYIYILLAFLTGIAISVQAGVNANLRQAMTNPVLAAAISFGTGFLALLVMLLVSGAGAIPSVEAARQVSWWKWTGGIIGAVYVTTVIVSVPKIGTANLVSLSVAGQLLAAVVLDHYGLLGFTLHPANGWRILGMVLIMAGVLLVVKN